MVHLTVCYIVENENNIFFVQSLKSALAVADNIIIIDGGSTDGTLDLIDSFNDKRIKVIHNKYSYKSKGANGRQRNEYLKWLQIFSPSDSWAIVLDADEILSDNAHKLRKYAESGEADVYDLKMHHFIYSFRWVDATKAGDLYVKDEKHIHRVLNRFFRVTKNIYYPEVEHPFIIGYEKSVGIIDEVVIYHLGSLKGIPLTFDKFNLNVAKSNMHTEDFLENWYKKHVNGTYPIRELRQDEIDSYLIRELMEGELSHDFKNLRDD